MGLNIFPSIPDNESMGMNTIKMISCPKMAEFIIKHAKKAALPKVLFFGDSISGGYSKPLAKLMEGKADLVKKGGAAITTQ